MSERWLVHTVVFDLDDTLYAESDYVLSGFRAVDEWLQKDQNVDGFFSRAKHRFLSGHRGRIFNEVLAELKISDPENVLVKQLIAVYRQHSPTLNLYSDAIDTLIWCEGKFNIGLITDGYGEVQRRKISALALNQSIPCRIVTDEIGRAFWKPHLEPYRRVMKYFDGADSGFVYIGDNPRKDFIGARQLGWRTIRILRESGEHATYEPDSSESAEVEINSLLQLKNLLSRMEDRDV